LLLVSARGWFVSTAPPPPSPPPPPQEAQITTSAKIEINDKCDLISPLLSFRKKPKVPPMAKLDDWIFGKHADPGVVKTAHSMALNFILV
jgi:hypothetical protein